MLRRIGVPHLKVCLLHYLTGRPVILFDRTAGIGDIICTFPAIIAFRKQHPEALLVYRVRRSFKVLVEMGRVADSIIDDDNSLSKSLIRNYKWILRPRLEDEKPQGRAHTHLVDDFSQTLGVIPASRQPRLYVSAKVSELQNRLVFPLRKDKQLVIGIHVGPSWRVREWTASGWQRLVELLHEQFNCVVLQLGSDEHTAAGTQMAPRIAGSLDWVNKFTLEQTIATLQLLDLFIGIDSGILHAAGAVGTPVVGLFGPINPRLRLPPENPAVAVTSSVPCLGCHHRLPVLHWFDNCPHSIACMRNITPEAVLDSISQLLAVVKQENKAV
jgi:ADP-heptose:LPS heptosyltransferase